MPLTRTLFRFQAAASLALQLQTFLLMGIALLVLVLALIACSSARSAALDRSTQWLVDKVCPTTSDADSLVQWWRRFDDPLLGALVTLALESNTQVSIAQATLRQVWDLRLLGTASDTKAHHQLTRRVKIVLSSGGESMPKR
jgi:hypothetical protein